MQSREWQNDTGGPLGIGKLVDDVYLRLGTSKMPITSLAQQLRRDEGFRGKPYIDTVGKMTVGYGRNLSDVGITMEEADFMLENDIRLGMSTLEISLPWTANLDEIRKAVLVAMQYNMGAEGLGTFRQMLEKVKAGDYAGASRDMLDSRWATQVGKRAQRLALQMELGIWQ